jgi:hypothetical protein
MDTLAPPPTPPWWHFRMAWFVFALPAAAVVASTLSAVIAIRHADPLVERPRGPHPALQSAEDAATQPAELARNHASLGR